MVKKIPKGRFLSYKGVAKLAGKPRAWRAVGNILNKNKNPEIPCHRVIKSNREIGGYRDGTKKKIYLLQREGMKIDIPNRRRGRKNPSVLPCRKTGLRMQRKR